MSLYSDYFYSKTINELFSDKQTIVQMLRFEGALALAQAENMLISGPTSCIGIVHMARRMRSW